MFQALKDIFTSRGFWKAIVGSIVTTALSYFHVPNEVLVIVGGIFGTSVLSQGMSDFGKNTPPVVVSSDPVSKVLAKKELAK